MGGVEPNKDGIALISNDNGSGIKAQWEGTLTTRDGVMLHKKNFKAD